MNNPTTRRQLREQRDRYGDGADKPATLEHYEFILWQLEREAGR